MHTHENTSVNLNYRLLNIFHQYSLNEFNIDIVIKHNSQSQFMDFIHHTQPSFLQLETFHHSVTYYLKIVHQNHQIHPTFPEEHHRRTNKSSLMILIGAVNNWSNYNWIFQLLYYYHNSVSSQVHITVVPIRIDSKSSVCYFLYINFHWSNTSHLNITIIKISAFQPSNTHLTNWEPQCAFSRI